MADDWFEVNREMWDERVPIHVASELLRRGGVRGGALPRCGRSSRPSWADGRRHAPPPAMPLRHGHALLARLGAEVTGLDFSFPAIEAARRSRRDSGVAGSSTPTSTMRRRSAAIRHRLHRHRRAQLAARRPRWARVMASLVAPGGCLYLAEFHPFTHVFGDDDLSVGFRVLPRARPALRVPEHR